MQLTLAGRTVRTSIVVALLLLPQCAFAGDKWEEADKQIVRRAPRTFGELPVDVVEDLEKRGCLIPQPSNPEAGNNIIIGEFAEAGHKDLAVLCSIDRVSTVLVYWRMSPRSVAEIDRIADIDMLQGTGDGAIGFSRVIEQASPVDILTYYEFFVGSVTPPAIPNHDGINDYELNKPSGGVRYFEDGEWRRLESSGGC